MLKFFTVALIFVVIIISLIWAFVLLKLPDKESKKKEKKSKYKGRPKVIPSEYRQTEEWDERIEL